MAVPVAIKSMTLLCLLVVTSSEWVDYPSAMTCCSNILVEGCDPDSPLANNACRDVCHYGGCRKGGQCVYLRRGVGRACHCNC
ncbi:uncharacterized protein A4U43_C04F31190 [Asparagus officinalis]|uniref:Knottin scorpion toxin-like domain-containing protein n=1 Tax=Asparagus officinalis TaxID=4686 RepID=A0A5P1F4W4_ASPOF|nr:uncharacterized protein A4U43_C04F31190 [Asparagus officinalis]